MTIKTVKGRDLPDIYADDKVRFVLNHSNKELEVSGFCKHTRNMSDGIITVYLQYPEPADENEEQEIDRLRREREQLLKEIADYRQHFTRFYP